MLIRIDPSLLIHFVLRSSLSLSPPERVHAAVVVYQRCRKHRNWRKRKRMKGERVRRRGWNRTETVMKTTRRKIINTRVKCAQASIAVHGKPQIRFGLMHAIPANFSFCLLTFILALFLSHSLICSSFDCTYECLVSSMFATNSLHTKPKRFNNKTNK